MPLLSLLSLSPVILPATLLLILVFLLLCTQPLALPAAVSWLPLLLSLLPLLIILDFRRRQLEQGQAVGCRQAGRQAGNVAGGRWEKMQAG